MQQYHNKKITALYFSLHLTVNKKIGCFILLLINNYLDYHNA